MLIFLTGINLRRQRKMSEMLLDYSSKRVLCCFQLLTRKFGWSHNISSSSLSNVLGLI